MVKEGEAATFAVVVAGTEPLNSQWQYWNGSNWEDIDGAASSSYTLDESLYPDDDGAMFRCHVFNTVNPTGVDSEPATLTVVEVL